MNKNAVHNENKWMQKRILQLGNRKMDVIWRNNIQLGVKLVFFFPGVHDGQMYAQAFDTPPQSIPERPSTIPEPTADSHEVAVIDQPYIGTWRPYISSSPSRTAALMNENGLTVFNQLDYPFGELFKFFAST